MQDAKSTGVTGLLTALGLLGGSISEPLGHLGLNFILLGSFFGRTGSLLCLPFRIHLNRRLYHIMTR